MMVIALWGAFMISLIVLIVSNVFKLSKTQNKAMKHIRLTRSAVKTIGHAYQFFKAKKRYYDIKMILNPELKETSEFVMKTKNLGAQSVDYMQQNVIDQRRISVTPAMQKQIVNELNIAFLDLQFQIEDFKIEKSDMKELLNKKEQEMLMSNRFIKQEV